MFEQSLTLATDRVLLKLAKQPWLKKFYLAGGTALALEYGHRQSVDLDWFNPKHFRTKTVIHQLAALGEFELLNEEEGTVDALLDDVKVSFFHYPYKLLEPVVMWNGVRLADPYDIACMKINAIMGRNAKKDFIDLYVFLEKEGLTLPEVFRMAERKFGPSGRDEYHLLRSLVFFEEANAQPSPKMTPPIDWKKIQQFFIREVKKLSI
jgi:hypothetical protein